MFPPALNAALRNVPGLFGQIDFVPSRSDRLAGSRRRQNGKFEPQRC
jgi:hypothetical protein